MDASPRFLRRKLNTCAHCTSSETAIVFTHQDRRIYFLCRLHWWWLMVLLCNPQEKNNER
jgi:hypothetical protein